MMDRFNTPQTDAVEVDVLGHNLLIKQDPNSKHLGTTVWDSSLVFVKFLERNSKKGEFSRAKLAGKRVIELGAGCGLAGLGMALLGCDVVVTDQIEVLPLLLRNVERNLSRAKYTASDCSYMGSIGKVDVAELDWGNETHITATGPPFDYIIGTDVVYKEQYLEPLINTILALAGPKTTVMLGYEFRSSGVRELLGQLCQKHFSVKRVLHSKMDPKYQHPDIDLFIMRVRDKSMKDEEHSEGVAQQREDVNASGGVDEENAGEEDLCQLETPNNCVQGEKVTTDSDTEDNAFTFRRMGSAAARLLSDVEPPTVVRNQGFFPSH
ncbi:protein N-lysine methyltransferase METTL21D [Marchantia polymorpha subsp. ruderalis]|uniref:Uncharacterized protein n=2 Tax=Marchantia polymorpha TaxID=3197 RepID=A0AAF6C0E1_MARPO|nr:hypothetical protein MARPO_0123s0035 [Marchantia polymorpha]BBN17725.1 hypothetical protein Mp_7g16530 [Marchantia polymorpha subsp. ruderalis]|eukprot:PTQ30548.1 hypothetical protein MARPO_0123s0035 [Marchantia polymorpha]